MLDEATLERHNRLLVDLARSADLRGGDLDQGLELVTRSLSRELGVDRVSVWALDEAEGQLTCLKLFDEDDCSFSAGAVLDAGDYPSYFEALREGRYVDAHDARSDHRTSEFRSGYLEPLGIHAMLDATVRRGGRVSGVLCCEARIAPRQWQMEERICAGAVADLVASFLEHLEGEAARAALDRTERRYQELFASARDALLILNGNRVVEYNPSAARLIGSGEAMLGQPLTAILPGTAIGEALKSVDESGAARAETTFAHPDGSRIELDVQFDAGRIEDEPMVLVWLRDVTERKRQQAVIEFQAFHDELTGLANRNALVRHVNRLIESESGAATPFALILFDLDRFKEINDTLGHELGDGLLSAIGRRLGRRVSDTGGFFCRLGGDEFVAVVHDTHPPEAIDDLAESLVRDLARPFEVGDLNLEIGCSMGIVLHPEDEQNLSGLLRTAEVAMYHAKAAGLSSQRYRSDMDPYTVDRLSLMMDLRPAVRGQELYLDFQPKVTLEDGQFCGCEALARWRHPRRGLIPPDRFIPLAEVSDLIALLTESVIRLACKQIRAWGEDGLSIPVAVNLSVRNLMDARFPDRVKRELDRYRIDPRLLEFEITESSMMHDLHRCRQSINDLADSGTRILIDDFGTGYSSLAYLQQLPVHGIKIDRSFVAGITGSGRDRTIVQTIIDLAHNLGVEVVAEGIENDETARALLEMGCDLGQGFYYGRPEPAAAISDLVLSGRA